MTDNGDTYTTSELVEVLGVGKRRVLQMLERGELEGTKDELGRWLVPAPQVHALLLERQQQDRRKRPKDGGEEGTPPNPEVGRELQDRLKDEIAFLRGELLRRDERHAEEIRRRDHLLAALTQRIPELEPVRDAPGARVTPSDEPPKGTAPEPTPKPQRRPWWRRIVGG